MPSGALSEAATHTRLSAPDWANNGAMRGCVCCRLPSQPPTGAATIFLGRWVPKAKRLSDWRKALRAATRRSVIPTVLGRTGSRDASSGGMRGEFIWCYSKARQQSVRRQHLYSGMAKVSHSSSTWARLPAAPPRVLPGDVSVTLKETCCHSRPRRSPQPDHEIGQLSCLPPHSTSP